MAFSRISFYYAFYLNKWKIGIKFCNFIKPGPVNIFIWKIVKKIAECKNIQLFIK